MKEKIYTIPISEAFAAPGICPFCTMRSQLESNFIESTLGASMMEPDTRIKTNELGFCNHHYGKLKEQQKALPLALVMQTHLEEQKNCLFGEKQKAKRKTFFGEKEDIKSTALSLANRLDRLSESCYICGRMEETMNKFIDNAIYMWDSEPEFREVFNQAPSFCLSHLSMLIKAGVKLLHMKKFEEFYLILVEKEKQVLDDLYQDVTTFSNSFDYRNNEPVTEKVKSAVKRAIDLL